jgi:hypothetical protein
MRIARATAAHTLPDVDHTAPRIASASSSVPRAAFDVANGADLPRTRRGCGRGDADPHRTDMPT